jgi:threonine/homoserine/homoserine lactone efflux protein
MPDPHTLAVFAAAAAVFAVIPGPAVFYVVTRSVTQGRTAGLVSMAAIETGNVVHIIAAALGLSAVLASSAVAFTVIKYLGAAYLVYLGVRALLDRGGTELDLAVQPRSLRRVYTQGVMVGVLNPKTALFFLAFLPQFVDPAKGSPALQLAVLGLLLSVITTVSDSAYALLTGTAGNWLRARARSLKFQRGRRLVTGGAYLTLGAVAATADGPAGR